MVLSIGACRECCGKVVAAEEAHEWKDGKCEDCGEDNSDTGDNAALVLFGSLLMLSVLAAGVLLIPDIRRKLIK